MDIIPLFPIALGKVTNFINEKERIQLIKSVKDTKHDKHGAILGDGVSTHDNLLSYEHKTPIINRGILNRLQEQCNEYARKYGIKDNLELTNVWSNIQNSSSILDEHCHPQSILSGALYLNVDDSCAITFHNPNPYIYFTTFHERNNFSYEWYRYVINNGDLVLFPSWLRHGNGTEVNMMNDRIVISFNTTYEK
tara:strand:+ start:53 stop:634 length:582 start_codon:yes stop_codon:yes gene_type:complete